MKNGREGEEKMEWEVKESGRAEAEWWDGKDKGTII